MRTAVQMSVSHDCLHAFPYTQTVGQLSVIAVQATMQTGDRNHSACSNLPHPARNDLQRITVPEFTGFKAAGRKISMVTAYDYALARLVDAAGVEGILVGDSMSMVVQGHDSTLPVTLDEMIYHAEMVGRAVEHALVVVDMPFPSFHLGTHRAIENAGRILKETRCQAVKLEGGVEQADTIAALVRAGIPVMAHCGLRPQSVHTLGGYKVQRDEPELLADAKAAEARRRVRHRAGMHPARAGQENHRRKLRSPRSASAPAPTATARCSCCTTCSGITSGYMPRFVKAYADLKTEITGAVTQYRDEVRDGTFPAKEHGYE